MLNIFDSLVLPFFFFLIRTYQYIWQKICFFFQVESVAQMHIFGNSPDEVTSRYYENRVTVLPLDPNLIVLNDGRENWERIKTGEMDIISYSRPTSNTDGIIITTILIKIL